MTKDVKSMDFEAAFKYALEQGIIAFGFKNFQGWDEGCECNYCVAQMKIYRTLFNPQLLEAAKAALDLNAFHDDDPDTAPVSEQLRQAIAEFENEGA